MPRRILPFAILQDGKLKPVTDRAPDGAARRRMLEQFDRLSPRGQVAAARFVAVLANDEERATPPPADG